MAALAARVAWRRSAPAAFSDASFSRCCRSLGSMGLPNGDACQSFKASLGLAMTIVSLAHRWSVNRADAKRPSISAQRPGSG
jgi:hypothetical protein